MSKVKRTAEQKLARKRMLCARRNRRLRLRKKKRAWLLRRVQSAINKAHRESLLQIKYRLYELRSMRYASAQKGFLDGWSAAQDLQDAHLWSKRYRVAFAEARTAKQKFEQQSR